MDVVRGTPAHYRSPNAIHPLTGMMGAGGGEDCVERPMPVEGAVFWTPIGQPAADPMYPIMISQGALTAVHSHLAVQSAGAASFGFLVGGVYVCPETRVTYIVAERAIHVPWSISGDHLKPALMQGRALALEDVQHRGAQLLGWYRCHVASHARLSSADVEAHLACFDKPWQVALVVARGVDLVGGVFRPEADGARANEYLPFYELAAPGGFLPDGPRVAGLVWANYRAETVALPAERVVPPAGATPHGVFLPDEADIDLDDAELEARTLPLSAPAPRWFLRAPLTRVVGLWALGLVGAATLFGAYRALASARAGDAEARAPSPVVTPASVEGLADSAAFAVAAFNIRARLYDERKMGCADLARGLIEVDDRWIAYSAARGVGGAGLDATDSARDRRLHADVGVVEQRFARTGCPRP